MPVEVVITQSFLKSSKSLIKKYPSFKKDLSNLVSRLEKGEDIGQRLTGNTYKIRVAIKSKGKGKSGGARVITLNDTQIILGSHEGLIKLLYVYNKSDTDNVSDNFIKELIRQLEE